MGSVQPLGAAYKWHNGIMGPASLNLALVCRFCIAHFFADSEVGYVGMGHLWLDLTQINWRAPRAPTTGSAVAVV